MLYYYTSPRLVEPQTYTLSTMRLVLYVILLHKPTLGRRQIFSPGATPTTRCTTTQPFSYTTAAHILPPERDSYYTLYYYTAHPHVRQRTYTLARTRHLLCVIPLHAPSSLVRQRTYTQPLWAGGGGENDVDTHARRNNRIVVPGQRPTHMMQPCRRRTVGVGASVEESRSRPRSFAERRRSPLGERDTPERGYCGGVAGRNFAAAKGGGGVAAAAGRRRGGERWSVSGTEAAVRNIFMYSRHLRARYSSAKRGCFLQNPVVTTTDAPRLRTLFQTNMYRPVRMRV